MDLGSVSGKWFGVLMISERPGREDELACFEGIATWDGSQLVIDAGDKKPFLVPRRALDRIQPVDEKLRLIFDHAEFYVPLLIGPLPENADLSEYAATGMRWPAEPDTRP